MAISCPHSSQYINLGSHRSCFLWTHLGDIYTESHWRIWWQGDVPAKPETYTWRVCHGCGLVRAEWDQQYYWFAGFFMVYLLFPEHQCLALYRDCCFSSGFPDVT